MSELLMLKNVRIAFANNVFTPKENPTGSAHYKVAAIIDKDSEHEKQIKAALTRAAKGKWAEKADAALRKLVADRRICYSSASPTTEDGEVYQGFENEAGVLNCSRNATKAEKAGVPLVIGGGADGRGPITREDGVVRSGCYVNLSIDFWAQDNVHGRRINADFRGLQYLKEGESLGGDGAAPTSANEFDTLDRADSLGEALDGSVPDGVQFDSDDDIPF